MLRRDVSLGDSIGLVYLWEGGISTIVVVVFNRLNPNGGGQRQVFGIVLKKRARRLMPNKSPSPSTAAH
jgi:hypothetical protein